MLCTFQKSSMHQVICKIHIFFLKQHKHKINVEYAGNLAFQLFNCQKIMVDLCKTFFTNCKNTKTTKENVVDMFEKNMTYLM